MAAKSTPVTRVVRREWWSSLDYSTGAGGTGVAFQSTGAPAARAPRATSRRRSRRSAAGRARPGTRAAPARSPRRSRRRPRRSGERGEVLLQPDDLVALGALAQRRPARVGQRDRRRRRRAQRGPRRGAGGLPAPPRQPAGAVARPDRAEALRCRRAAGRRRPARAARSARRRCGCARRCCALTASTVPPIVLPVDLRQVRLRAAGAEEHRVRQARVVVDVRERRQADRIARADRGAQRVRCRLRRGVAALVRGLGVDDEAVRAVGDRVARPAAASASGSAP